MSFWKWSQTAALNGTIDGTVVAQEGQAPSTVNNGMRGIMAALAKYRDDRAGIIVTTGTATAFAVSTGQILTTLTDGFTVTARMHTTCGASPTLNVDGLGAKPIAVYLGVGTPERSFIGGSVQTFVYNSAANVWVLHGFLGVGKCVGEIFDYAGAVAPAFCLLCYGQTVSRTTYAALFAVIGETYGAGDGSTTFGIPDLRGRVVAGQDDMGGSSANRLTNQTGGLDGDALGASGGSETHTLTATQLAAHTHSDGSLSTDSQGAHTHTLTIDGWAYGSGGSAVSTVYSSAGDVRNTVDFSATTASSGAHTHDVTGVTGSAGSDGAHNNVQPTFILNKCIFAGA